MAAFFILALIAVVAKLWSDVRTLRRRVLRLEWATGTASEPPAWQSFQQPMPWQPYAPPGADAWSQHAPSTREPWQPPVAESVPATTARVVHEEQPDVVTSDDFRHPGPEAEFRSSDADRRSAEPEAAADVPAEPAPTDVGKDGGIPAQGRGDEWTPTSPPPPVRTFSFEDIFGRKLPIWAGGVTLAVCGFLIVKYSIEAGLISPIIRVIGGLLFGSGLIAGAEAARQNAERVRDPRVAQALSGAGVATLYASVLVATNLYHLIPPLAAFLFMAAITVVAGALSIRFGAPSAVLGLVGGLAAPALVGGGNPNVPLLAAYLSLAVGGLAALGRAQRWWWLGVAALAGGFGWGFVLILDGALGLADSLSVGGFLLVLGVGLPVLLFGGERGVFVRLAGTLAATAQLAALVAAGGFTMLNWGLFGLLGIASVWLSRRERPLADLPAPALLTALLLMAAWPLPTPTQLAIVFGSAAAIFGLPAAWRAWRAEGRLSDVGGVCAIAAAPLALALYHFNTSDRDASLLALLGAAAAGLVAALGWRVGDRQDDSRFALLSATSALLAGIAVPFAVDSWLVAPLWAVLAALLLVLAGAARDWRVEALAWLAGAVALVTQPLTPFGQFEPLARMVGEGHDLNAWQALRWALPALVALLFATASRWPVGRAVGAATAVLLGYAAAAQVVPATLVPLIPVLALAALGFTRRGDSATASAGALTACWVVWPLMRWLAAGGGGLIGFWVHASDLPTPANAATRLLAPALALAVVLWRHPPSSRGVRQLGWGTVALLGTAVAHIVYKQYLGLATPERFVIFGLGERTGWEALLTLIAVATWRRWPDLARGFGLAALTHLAWFTLLLHNPLWSEQRVGVLPIANFLLPAYGIGFVLLWAAGRIGLPAAAERVRGWAQMLLIGLFAASELRQFWHGTLLAGGGLSQAEDIARSIVAVGVAVGFLLWGIRRQQRDWRIASLIVMLGAVLKVFLLDTSGLDGLLRIASFAALGFSLIGIGWLYSRYLPDGGEAPPSMA